MDLKLLLHFLLLLLFPTVRFTANLGLLQESHSLENSSGNRKWGEKLRGNANELLIMQSLKVIEKKRGRKKRQQLPETMPS